MMADMGDYDGMTNQDVDPVDVWEEMRDAELRLDAADEARAAEEDRAAQASESDDELEDCGAVTPDDMCGICEGCRESTGDDIEAQHESGSITYEEAVSAHQLNGTWG